MATNLAHRLYDLGKKILLGMRRFPAAVAASAAIMVLVMVLQHNHSIAQPVQDWLTRILFTLGLGIPLSVAVQLWLERGEHKPWLAPAAWVALAALLLLYLLLLLPKVETMIPMLCYFSLLLAAVAIVPAVPFLPGCMGEQRTKYAASPRRQGDERLALKLLWRLFITGVFTGILIGGASLVLLMLDKLLNVKLWDEAYFDVSVLSIGLFAPSFFLAGIPSRDAVHKEEPFQPLLRILLGYIIFPLLSIYTVIIYAYFVRILILWSWPSNMLVNMVLWYTAIGALAVYFMRSQSPLNRWFALFERWYPRLTVLPLVLMYIGILIRIGAYGFTESRYFVLVLGIWVTAFTAIAIFQRPEKRLNVLAPTLLAALAVLAVLGPWSAFNVSRMSQTARFESILVRNSMLSADRSAIVSKKDIPDGDKASLYSILDYFNNRQTPDTLPRLPSDFSMDKAPALLGFSRPISIGGPQQQGIYISLNEQLGTLEVGDYDFIYFGEKGAFNGENGQGAINASIDSNSILTITHDGKTVYQKDLKDYAKAYVAAYSPSKVYTLDDLTQRDDTDTVAVKYIFTNISTNLRDDTTEYYITPYCVMFRIK